MAWGTPKTTWASTDGVANTDLNRIEENIRVLESTGNSLPTTSGTAPAYVVTIPDFIGLIAGRKLTVNFHAANNAAATTINPNSTGVKAIVKAGGGTPNIKAGAYTLVYTGTNFQLLGEGGEYGNVTADKVLAGTTFGTENGLASGTIVSRPAATIPSSIIPWSGANGGYTYHLSLRIPLGAYLGEYPPASGNTEILVHDDNFTDANIKYGVPMLGRIGSGPKYSIGEKIPYTALGTYPTQKTIVQGDIGTYSIGIFAFTKDRTDGNYVVNHYNSGSLVLRKYHKNGAIDNFSGGLGGGVISWTNNIGTNLSDLVSVGSKLYAYNSSTNQLVSINPTTGAVTNAMAFTGRLYSDGTYLYTISGNTVTKYNENLGAVWSTNLGTYLSSVVSISIYGNYIMVNGNAGIKVLINRTSGAFVWVINSWPNTTTAYLAGDGRFYVRHSGDNTTRSYVLSETPPSSITNYVWSVSGLKYVLGIAEFNKVVSYAGLSGTASFRELNLSTGADGALVFRVIGDDVLINYDNLTFFCENDGGTVGTFSVTELFIDIVA